MGWPNMGQASFIAIQAHDALKLAQVVLVSFSKKKTVVLVSMGLGFDLMWHVTEPYHSFCFPFLGPCALILPMMQPFLCLCSRSSAISLLALFPSLSCLLCISGQSIWPFSQHWTLSFISCILQDLFGPSIFNRA